jgi:hypothetical protein
MMLDEIRMRSNNAATRLLKLIEGVGLGLVSYGEEMRKAGSQLRHEI